MRPLQVISLLSWLVMLWAHPLAGQSSSKRHSPVLESSGDRLVYSTRANQGLEGAERISQYRKILDDKNYLIRTTTRVPSVNGGEKIDRQIVERSQQISQSEVKVELVVKSPDLEGRLTVREIVSESHQLAADGEKIERNIYRPDPSGRMIAQSVEKERVQDVSPGQRRVSKDIYRLDAEGELTLAEEVEGTHRKLSDQVSVVEKVRRMEQGNGNFIPVERMRETTTQEGSSLVRETVVRKADDAGRLVLTDRSRETTIMKADGTRHYERLLESRNLTPQTRNVEGGLILARRVTGEERKLADGTIQNQLQVETLDPVNLSDGLRVTQKITETSRALEDGRVEVERVIKARDPNGNFVEAQRMLEVVRKKQ